MPRSSSSSRSQVARRPSPPLPPSPSKPTLSGPFTPTSPTFGQTIKDGFAFGIGSSLARNMVDSFLQKPAPVVSLPTQTTVSAPSGTSVETELQKKEYIQCMETTKNEEYCKEFIKTLH